MYNIKFLDLDNLDYIFYIDDKIMKFNYKEYSKEEFLGEDIKNFFRRFFFLCLKDIINDIYFWGILIGIRFFKIVLKFFKEGNIEEKVIEIFKEKYLVYEDKVRLCIDVVKVEERIVNKDKNNIVVYIGMVFCLIKCMYCLFILNFISVYKKMVMLYVEVLMKEIREISKYVKEKNFNVELVYFGGGILIFVSDGEFMMVMDEIYNDFIKECNVKEFIVECGRFDILNRNKL